MPLVGALGFASACKKPPPAAAPSAALPGDAPAPDGAPPADAAAAPATGTAEPAPAAPATDVRAEKSEELRFVEANAALLCFDKQNKRKPKDGERAVILKDHGFGGRPGEGRFTELSIRGEKDPEWGRRTGGRIQDEVRLLCPPPAAAP